MRILSGIQPSGKLHIGNYFGMMRPALELQKKGDAYLFIADYDGDGRDDLAVYHTTSGDWYVRHSSDNRVRLVRLGGRQHIPAHPQATVHSWYGLP